MPSRVKRAPSPVTASLNDARTVFALPSAFQGGHSAHGCVFTGIDENATPSGLIFAFSCLRVTLASTVASRSSVLGVWRSCQSGAFHPTTPSEPHFLVLLKSIPEAAKPSHYSSLQRFRRHVTLSSLIRFPWPPRG